MREQYIELKRKSDRKQMIDRIASIAGLILLAFVIGFAAAFPAHAQSQCMKAKDFQEFTEENNLQAVLKIDTERGTIHVWMDDEGDGVIFLNRGDMACYMGQGEVMFRVPRFEMKDL